MGNSYNPSGELGVYGGTAQTNLNAINQNLDPEENQNYEVGAQWDIAAGLQIRASIFRNEKTNARMADPTTGRHRARRQAARRRHRARGAGSITPNWDIYSGIAFMDGEIVTGTGERAGQHAARRGRRGGQCVDGLPASAAASKSGAARAARRARGSPTRTPGSQIPGYVVLDCTAAYVQKQYEIRLNVYNVFDKQYYSAATTIRRIACCPACRALRPLTRYAATICQLTTRVRLRKRGVIDVLLTDSARYLRREQVTRIPHSGSMRRSGSTAT